MRNPALRLAIAAGAIGATLFALMRGGLVPAPGVGVLSAQAQPQAEPVQRPPVFRGGTTFVSVDVYPRQDGRPIEGLTKDDFEITEDGKPQVVETFQFIRFETALVDDERRDPTSVADSERQAADPRNRVFVVYLDPYHLSFVGSLAVPPAVMAFLTRTIGPTDLFATMYPKRPVSQLTFGRRLEVLEEDLRDFWNDVQVGIDEVEFRLETCPEITSLPAREQNHMAAALIARHQHDMLMTSLENLMRRLGGLRDERKNVLFMSEGWNEPEPLPELTAKSRPKPPQIGVSPSGRLGTGPQQPYNRDENWCAQNVGRLAHTDFEDRFIRLLDLARQANVTFYPVDVGGQRGLGLSGPVAKLRTLAENTDGTAIFNTNDVTGAVRRLTDSISAYYLLGYYSTNPSNDGKYREIKVRVKRPDVGVSARRGYFAPTPEMMAAAARAAAAPPVAPTAVDAEVAKLARARPDAELFTHGTARGQQLHIVTELSSREVESGRWKAGATVRATVQSSSGAPSTVTTKIEPGARVVTFSIPATGTTGPWKVDVKVSAVGEVLDSTTSVASPVGPLLGDPTLFRANPSPRAPLKPVADFQYRRTERIHVEWPVLKDLTSRAARLLDVKGQALPVEIALSDRESAEGKALVADLNLAPLIEGSYVMELTCSAGTESQRALVGFRVVR
jgi:VWFA-related protein